MRALPSGAGIQIPLRLFSATLFALVMIPVSYNSKTGMAIMLIRTGKFKHESHSRYGNIKPIPYVLMRHSTYLCNTCGVPIPTFVGIGTLILRTLRYTFRILRTNRIVASAAPLRCVVIWCCSWLRLIPSPRPALRTGGRWEHDRGSSLHSSGRRGGRIPLTTDLRHVRRKYRP